MNRTPDAVASGAGGRHGSPWRAAGVGLVALLALVGAGMLGAALNAPPGESPPQPSAGAAPTYLDDPVTVGPGTGADRPARTGVIPDLDPALGSTAPTGRPDTPVRSVPTAIAIPKIKVDAKIMPLGVDAEGMVEVPPLRQAQLAGWYRLGPAPGDAGNAVIIGHVDSKEMGPAVFFRLGSLLAGDTIEITRQDGGVAAFVVEGVKSYPKTAFPTELVYGPSEVPGLRLVTCGGDFDERLGSYPDNIIVFASLAT